MDSAKINLAVMFGGKSVEHEVSIVTGLQILENADKNKYNLIPIYISKQGKWYTGSKLLDINNFKNLETITENLQESYINPGSSQKLIPITQISPLSIIRNTPKIDVVFPAFHGTFGEDGTVQGVLEMAGIPYVGSGVISSAIGMDKILQKDIFKANGIPVVNYTWIVRNDWFSDSKLVIKKIKSELHFPVIVKPANLGSSIGISKANDDSELTAAIELAVNFDRRIIIEECLENIIEINCSVMGYKEFECSICEQPIKTQAVLSFEDKYLKGSKTSGMASLSRIMPAPISPKITSDIQEMAIKVFKTLDCTGLARIDFLVNVKSGNYYVCEINTIPGSVSFYLWEKSGYSFPKLIDKLVELARQRSLDRSGTSYSFSSNLLQTLGKGAKGTKN